LEERVRTTSCTLAFAVRLGGCTPANHHLLIAFFIFILILRVIIVLLQLKQSKFARVAFNHTTKGGARS
jgi:hypothetical protein